MKPLLTSAILCVATMLHAGEPQNVSGFLGPNRNSIYPATGLARSWPAEGPKKLWEAQVAKGWSAPSAANGLIYFAGSVNNEGRIQALGLDGKEVFNAVCGPEKPSQISRATPSVADGRLYYESTLGVLYCLDAAKGATLWSVDMKEHGESGQDVDAVSWSPLLYGNLVIVASRCKTNDDPSFIAFDAKTGKLAWKGNLGPCPDKGKTWSSNHHSPILVDTAAGPLAINGYFRCVAAVKANTGDTVWNIILNDPSNKHRKLGAIQPTFHEGYLFLAGTVMQKLQADGSFKTLWEGSIHVPEYNVSYSHTIIRDGRLILFTPPVLTCLEADTGKLINTVPCGGQGSIIMADDMVILFDNRPRVELISVSKEGMKVVSSFTPPIGGGKNDNFCHPAVVNGQLILRKFDRVIAYDLRQAP
jgi:outer membrane protein assembly factor BamB